MPVTEQDYRNILARMRVDPLFRSLVVQIMRENLDGITGPILREVDVRIRTATDQKKYY